MVGERGPLGSSKHVLVVAKDFPPTLGGVETYSAEVARAYVRLGCTVTVLTQHSERAEGYADTDYLVLRVRRGSQMVVAAAMLRRLRQLRRSESYDLIHCTTWRVAVPSRVVFRDVPTCVTVHGREIIHYPRLAGPALKWSLAGASSIVAVSYATAGLLLGKRLLRDEERVAVRWNGLTYPELAQQKAPRTNDPGPLRVLSLARLVPRKNIDKCLHAMADLVQGGLDVRYTIAGRGPELERLKKLAGEVLPDGVVTFAGYVPDEELPSLYAEHDVFLHPHSNLATESEFEGFGIVIADAMSFGCTVVVGRDGGPGDYVNHQDTGLLVNGDDPAEIASAMRALACDHEARLRMSAAGRDYALTNFSWLAHVQPLLE